MVRNFAVFTGSSVIAVGRGADSIIVILSRGRVERWVAGMSAGEQARSRCRRWVFAV
jgi:hypothetical protein